MCGSFFKIPAVVYGLLNRVVQGGNAKIAKQKIIEVVEFCNKPL